MVWNSIALFLPGNMITLRAVSLRKCPISFPPQEVLQQGLAHILQFLRRTAVAQRPLSVHSTHTGLFFSQIYASTSLPVFVCILAYVYVYKCLCVFVWVCMCVCYPSPSVALHKKGWPASKIACCPGSASAVWLLFPRRWCVWLNWLMAQCEPVIFLAGWKWWITSGTALHPSLGLHVLNTLLNYVTEKSNWYRFGLKTACLSRNVWCCCTGTVIDLQLPAAQYIALPNVILLACLL